MKTERLNWINLSNRVLVDDGQFELWLHRLSADNASIGKLSVGTLAYKTLEQNAIQARTLSATNLSTEFLFAHKGLIEQLSTPHVSFTEINENNISTSWSAAVSENRSSLMLSSQMDLPGEDGLPETYGIFQATAVSNDVALTMSRLSTNGMRQSLSVDLTGFSILNERLGDGNVLEESSSVVLRFPDNLSGEQFLAVKSDLDQKQDKLADTCLFALQDLSSERATIFEFQGQVEPMVFDWHGELRLSDLEEAGFVSNGSWIRRPTSIKIGSAITSIGYEALRRCPAENIQLLPGLKEINAGAFSDMENLRLLVIPKSVQTIDTDAFGYEESEAAANLTVAFEDRTPDEIERVNYYPWNCDVLSITISALAPATREWVISEISGLSAKSAEWDMKYSLPANGIPLSDINPDTLSDFVKIDQLTGFQDDPNNGKWSLQLQPDGGAYVKVPAESEKIDDNTIKRNEVGELYANAAGISSMLLNNFQQKGDYATEEWVEAKNYLSEDSLAGYATEEWVEAKNYLSEDSLAGYATEEWVENKNYSNIQVEQEHFGGTHIATITVDGQQTKLYAPTAGEPVQPNNPTITITQGGVSKGSFTLNQTSDQMISLDAVAVPDTYKNYDDTVTALTSESGFKTYVQTSAQLSNDGYATQAWVQEQGFGRYTIRVVEQLPSDPDSNTFYFVTE